MDVVEAEKRAYFYPNRMGRVILAAMEKEIGWEQLDEALRVGNLEELHKPPPSNQDKKFPFERVSALQAAIETTYGAKAGRSMNNQIGGTCFHTGLKEFDPILGIADLLFRLIPPGIKFRFGLDVFALVFNQFSDQVVRINESDDNFEYLSAARFTGDVKPKHPVVSWRMAFWKNLFSGLPGGVDMKLRKHKALRWVPQPASSQ